MTMKFQDPLSDAENAIKRLIDYDPWVAFCVVEHHKHALKRNKVVAEKLETFYENLDERINPDHNGRDDWDWDPRTK